MTERAEDQSRVQGGERRRFRRLRRATWSTRVAVAVLAVMLLVVTAGPLVAPHSEADIVGPPGVAPSSQFPLGTDYLGEDVLSRLFVGGRHLIILAVSATLLAYLVGGTLGMLAGYSRSLVDPAIMRAADLLLAFPSLFLILLLAARFGSSTTIVLVGVMLVHVPYVARLMRTATLETSTRSFVEASVARGDSTFHILVREILPNVRGPISADIGTRLTLSILLIAGLNFLGIGVAPPAANWAVMINENRSLLGLNSWAVIAPALLIALLTISISVVTDVAALGRTSLDPEGTGSQ